MFSDTITDTTIKRYNANNAADFYVWDKHITNFALRIRKSGHKTYVLFYRPANRKKQRQYTLGSAKALRATDARRLAQQLIGRIAAGEDPADDKSAYKAASLKAAFETFKSSHLPSLSVEHAKHRERIFNKHFLPALGDKLLTEITRGDVKTIIDRIAKSHKIAASNAQRGFSAFLSWCLDSGLIENHPLRGMRLPASYQPREHILTDAEIVAVWRASSSLTPLWRDYIRMLILTGQRRMEVASMHWDDIKLSEKQWTIPSERAKNRRKHLVPLSSQALQVLANRQSQSGYVFPSPKIDGTYVHSFGGVADKLRAAANTRPFRIHDLRRTAASTMGKLSIAPHVIERVLNHRSGVISGIAAIYNRYTYEREVTEAIESYGAYLDQLICNQDA